MYVIMQNSGLLAVKCPIFLPGGLASMAHAVPRTRYLSSELEYIVPLMLKVRAGTQSLMWRISEKRYLSQKGRGEKIYEMFYSSISTVKSADFFLQAGVSAST